MAARYAVLRASQNGLGPMRAVPTSSLFLRASPLRATSSQPTTGTIGTSGALLRLSAGHVHCLSTAVGDQATSESIDSASDNEDSNAKKVEAPGSGEEIAGELEAHEFGANHKRLLDIVAKSLYSDPEVFVRELISNCSDACEKLRQMQLASPDVDIADKDEDLAIYITGDPDKGTLTIQDTGVGMSKEELIGNLGTIAKSGSLDFIMEQKDGAAKKEGTASNIIGQFGVGFYSAFMVGTKVEVYSRPATGDSSNVWVSSGDGNFEVAPSKGVARGTKIVITLRDDAKEYADESNLQRVVQKYSNFVTFPIYVNGTRTNIVDAMWMKSPNEIDEQDHQKFYQFISGSWDVPMYNFTYTADAPLSIRSLFYVPQMQTEKFGMGRMEAGVSLMCRKVLIQSKAEQLLPEWLRFIRGVVDSEDIPLNLSREMLQNNRLIMKLNQILSRRIVSMLTKESRKDEEKYEKFFDEFGNFLKEGVCTDERNSKEIAKLLLFESSGLEPGKRTTFDQYIDRMPEDQKEIYFIVAPSRNICETSPYMDALKEKGTEVLFLYDALDDIVMSHVKEIGGKKVSSVETSEIDIESGPIDGALDEAAQDKLKGWLMATLGNKVSEVKISKRLVDAPAIIVDHGSAQMRRMMRMVDPKKQPESTPQVLEINPGHKLIRQLADIQSSRADLATLVAEQMFDNALVTAGLLDEPRSMIPRITDLMNFAIENTATTNRDQVEEK